MRCDRSCNRTASGRASRYVRSPDSRAQPDGSCLQALSVTAETSVTTREGHAVKEWWEHPSAPLPGRRWRAHRLSPCDRKSAGSLRYPFVFSPSRLANIIMIDSVRDIERSRFMIKTAKD